MIKAIVFDCYGVLASEKLLPFREKYFGSRPQLAARVTELIGETTSGLLDYNDFIKVVSKLAGVSEQNVRQQIEGNSPNVPLFEFIETELKPAYKIGLLSNAGRNRLDEIFTREQLAVFDAVGLSYEIGASKPDSVTYTTIAERLQVEAEQCIFVDDQQKYCDGAAAVGMKAILYENLEAFKATLETLA